MTRARLGVLEAATATIAAFMFTQMPDGCTRLCSDVAYSERPPLAARPDGLLLAPYAVHTPRLDGTRQSLHLPRSVCLGRTGTPRGQAGLPTAPPARRQERPRG